MNWWALRRRVHVSWLIALLAAGCVTGVWLASVVPVWWLSSVVWLAVAAVLLGLVLWRRYIMLVPLCVAAGMLVGLWRGSAEQGQLVAYQQLVGKTVELRGVVKEDASEQAGGTWVLRLGDVRYSEQSLPGTIWVTVAGAPPAQRSDTVTVKSKVKEGFGVMAASMYRASVVNVQRPNPGDVALGVRDWFAELVRQAIPEPQASLGLGYLLGQRRSLPPELSEALQIAGLTHIVVASGYNLTILVRLARRLFEKVSRYTALLAASGMVLSFMAITGDSPSMARAGLVTGLSLLAWYYGRKFHPLVLLPIAAAVTVLANPSYAWGDIGWLLSFAAFAGVMILAPLLQAYFFGDKKPGLVRQIMGETIAAQLATLPILVVSFGQLSLVALVANAAVLPLVPLAMLLTALAGAGALVLPAAVSLVGLPASWLLGYMVWVAEKLAGLPWAMVEVALPWWGALVAYSVLIAACIYMKRTTGYALRQVNIVE